MVTDDNENLGYLNSKLSFLKEYMILDTSPYSFFFLTLSTFRQHVFNPKYTKMYILEGGKRSRCYVLPVVLLQQ